MLKLEEEDGLAIEKVEEQEGEDYHTFTKIEFILEILKQEKELFQNF